MYDENTVKKTCKRTAVSIFWTFVNQHNMNNNNYIDSTCNDMH